MRGLYVMTEAECCDLLQLATVGRAGVTTAQGPYVVPVNYALIGDSIYFRVQPTTVLGKHVDGAVMAFEVDRIMPGERTGWSVLVRGTGRVVRDQAEAELVDSVGGPEPWNRKPDRTLYAMEWTELSGRRMWEQTL